MSELSSEMFQVQEIIDKYLAIHDKIFKFSWRKVIPIPGIFKPVDYDQHSKELDSLVDELEGIIISKNNSFEVIDLFRRYTSALRKTIQFLRNICGRLDKKSQGGPWGYTIDQYKSDVDLYEKLAERYRLLASALNEYIRNENA